MGEIKNEITLSLKSVEKKKKLDRHLQAIKAVKNGSPGAKSIVDKALIDDKKESGDVNTILLMGDHEIDPKRHGPDRLIDELGVLGAQDFVQRVGGENGYLVVGISTPLRRDFTREQFQKMSQSHGKQGEEAWVMFQETLDMQNDLIMKAAGIAEKENRKVVLMGHQANHLEEFIQTDDIKEGQNEMKIPNVVMELAGHEHKRTDKKVKSIKNNRGEEIRKMVPGAPTFGAFGVEATTKPTMDLLDIKGLEGMMEAREVPVGVYVKTKEGEEEKREVDEMKWLM
jgi:hypothetical protein